MKRLFSLLIFVGFLNTYTTAGSFFSNVRSAFETIEQLFISSRQSKDYRVREDGIYFPGGMVEGYLIIDYDVEYSRTGRETLTMDIYFPLNLKQKEKSPAVIYVHGGAWASGNKESGPGLLIIAELVKNGYLVAAVDYRLAPAHIFPAQIEDVKTAVRFLRQNAAVYGIDASRIGAFGTSAGGHLVSLAGLTPNYDLFRGDQYKEVSDDLMAVADLFGPTDLESLFIGLEKVLAEKIFGKGEDALKVASPKEYVRGDGPPFLIIQGDKDVVVPPYQSEEFYRSLVESGNYAELLIVRNAGHGFVPSGGKISPSLLEIAGTVVEFFDRFLSADY
jgi:acetyl esterase/lipase